MTVRVLAIDGGGVRGMIPAVVIAALERAAGKPIAELFDLVAGSSTGGIIATGLAHPTRRLSGEDVIQFYRNDAPKIFNRGWGRTLSSVFSLADEKYSAAPLSQVLQDRFGADDWLSQLPGNTGNGPELLITSYDIQNRRPALFKSWRARGQLWDCDDPGENAADKDFRLWEIARATSAAPTYFEPASVRARSGRTRELIDGGVYANNPAMTAYVTARKIFPQEQDILILSIGTGEDRHPFDVVKAKNWGLIEWARPLFKVLLGGLSDSVDYQLRELMPDDRYLRITKDFDGGIGHAALQVIDDASKKNLAGLEAFARGVVDDYAAQIANAAGTLSAMPRAKAGP